MSERILDQHSDGWRKILDRLPAGVYTCDAEGLITSFNDVAVQMWGRAPKLNDPVDRFCGSFNLYSADGSPINHDECWMAQALRTGESFNGQEIVIERADGSRLSAMAHANPIFDDAGRLLGAVNVLVDVSDRKRADETQRMLAAIVESSDDAIISKSLDGRILTWNAGAERLFGYSAQDAIGRPITLIIPPERQHEELAILERLRRGERIDHFETERISKDARRIPISLTISPVRDGSGRIVAASKVARDITSKKESQAALLAIKDEMTSQLADLQRLHGMSRRLSTTRDLQPILQETLATATAIESADFGLLSLCEVDENSLKVGASLGFSEEYLKFIERVPAGGGACGTCFQERRRVIVEDVEADPVFASFREAARRAGFRAVHSTPLITRQGTVVGVLSTHFRRPHRPTSREMRLIDLCARQAVDFIENARLYAALRQADQRKDEFLATLAHELRNPLAPISNALQVLRLSDDLGPAAERMREVMERQVAHLARLVDDLMEVSRITRGRVELRKEPVELVAAISNAVETSRPMIDAAGHQLMISLSPEPMTLEADPVRLSQIIANLLNNAAKYTDRGGQIWLTVRREQDVAVISVRDSGVGIAPEMLPRVFDMFSQVDRTLNRANGGLGIGLTLAKTLVQMHGGQIEARSEGLGTGSEFIVRLPLILAAVPTRAPAPAVRHTGPLPSHRILVVDDTRAAAYMLGKLLEAMGQQVRTVHDAASALASVRADQPDVVVSDIAMPNMDGYELARHLRREAGHRVVLVALTGYGQDSDRAQAKAAGFDHHLVKPVSQDALYRLLSSLAPLTDGPWSDRSTATATS